MKKEDYHVTTIIDDVLRLLRKVSGRAHMASTTFIRHQEEAEHELPKMMTRRTDLRVALVTPPTASIDLTRLRVAGVYALHLLNALSGEASSLHGDPLRAARESPRPLDWVICGADPDTGDAPICPDWVEALKNQCEKYRVPFFFTGWGDWLPWREMDEDTKKLCYSPADEFETDPESAHLLPHKLLLTHGTTGVAHSLYRVGLVRSNRRLLGREYLEIPSPRKR